MTHVLLEAVRDVRTLSAFMIGGLGLIFFVSRVGRNQVPSAWLSGALIGLGIAQGASVAVDHGIGPEDPMQQLMAISMILLPTVAALFVGLRAFFHSNSRSHGEIYVRVLASGLALIALVFGVTKGWPFSGPLAIALMCLAGAAWLLHVWMQHRWWGQLVMAASLLLLPGALLYGVFSGLSLMEYRQLATYPTTFICIALITLILTRDADLLSMELAVRKEAEQALKRLTESLEEKVAMRTESLQEVVAGLQSFAAMVSHDLRGPVRNVTGLAAMALEDVRQGDATGAEKALARILLESQRGASMINDLLSLAQVDKGGLLNGEIDTGSLLHEAVQSLGLQYPEALQRVVIGSMPRVMADAGLLRHVANNLIGNALKFGCGKHDLRVEVTARRDGPFWRFEVSDNGPGFDGTRGHQLFKPFARLTNTDVVGTGLGLTVVKRAVERLGGRSGASGELGCGATFWWTLPAHGRICGTAVAGGEADLNAASPCLRHAGETLSRCAGSRHRSEDVLPVS